MRIVAVGDSFTVDALRLMGIPGTVAADAAQAAAALDEAIEPETVILVGKSVADMIREKVEELKSAPRDYIVLEIPSGEEVPHQAEETARLVSEAIGIKI